MLLITCPHCGPRAETEFRNGGEAGIVRPTNSAAMSDQDWARYVFSRDNPKGRFHERWLHAQGCGRWFTAVRSTVTDEFESFHKVGDRVPGDHR
ncbi:MAG TPA: sarcosine oxidase subunit delta [Geminicoccus sp.]|jgi:heterotetrameric sarcosine oxidase delta subunit|uniref:sarcosine oxidase subunit delta n=1 Tax=Geminicoccus sp. TaxID=2024832 RepID=UPI002E345781|nr:sarcosine oxidase subunit delta [Geminicoccus sp.]HEX2526948.1 sarcosine oxidase subunit delta [Geminicoccus sp.]